MNSAIQYPVTLKLARPGFVVFALLALSLVLARPVCDAYHLQGGPSQSGPVADAGHALGEALHHEDSAPCCASLEDGALAVPATVAIPAVKLPASLLAATASLPGWRAATLLLAAEIPPDRPPVSRPYYARSARILI
jgi:hypothetical protein